MTYLRKQLKALIVLLSIYLILIITFTLYHIPLEAFLYPFFLSLLIIFTIGIFDYFNFKNKHKSLQNNNLPKPKDLIEQDYQKIIFDLKKEISNVYLNEEDKYEEMMNYYTTWVHQIKTPIASMKLSLQNEDTALSRKIGSDLIAIENYVEMVLAYLRLDSSTNDLVIIELNLNNVVRNCVRHFYTDFINKKISVEINNIDQVVLSDEKWLTFIIEQLLSNALKYTKSGKISIYFQDKSLYIKDSGIGIDEKDLPRIFEKGYTGYNGRLNNRSSGLGLYLVKRCTDLLSIDIKIDSVLGKGTTVILSFKDNVYHLD